MPDLSKRFAFVAAGLLALCAALAWSNTFRVPFLDDDIPSILQNPAVKHFWPWWEVLAERQPNLGARPVVLLSLAANHAISGFRPWSYHVVNLIAHILAAWVLFGVARRTIPLSRRLPVRGSTADLLAFFIALAWALHPLQTQPVTYVIQRCEVFMGLFFLLALYLAVRGWQSDRPGPWHLGSVAACVLGMGCKEVMAVAPLAVLAWDRVFMGRGLKRSLSASPALWAGYGAAWAFLAFLLVTVPDVHTLETRGALSHTRAGYLITQPEVVLHYLRLALWPRGLSYSYGWEVSTPARALLPALAVLGMVLASAWGVWRKKPLGFAGLWVFLILFPSSGMVPLNLMAAEHRMYLSLAAVIAVAVAGGHALARRVAAGTRMSLGAAAHERNKVYADPVTLWADSTAKRPENFRAFTNLGVTLLERGDKARAMEPFVRAVALAPDFPEGQYNLGSLLAMEGRNDEAEEHLRRALRLKPGLVMAWVNLGKVALAKGDPPAALQCLDRAVALEPQSPNARMNRGIVLKALGKAEEGAREMHLAAVLDPALPQVIVARALAVEGEGDLAQAEALYREAIRTFPVWQDPWLNLGILQARRGRTAEAVKTLGRAVELSPRDPEAWYNLGVAMDLARNAPGAVDAFRKAVALSPGHEKALNKLGVLLVRSRDVDGAIRAWTTLAGVNPGHLSARVNLGQALLLKKRFAEASDQFTAALSLDPKNATARKGLETARKGLGSP